MPLLPRAARVRPRAPRSDGAQRALPPVAKLSRRPPTREPSRASVRAVADVPGTRSPSSHACQRDLQAAERLLQIVSSLRRRRDRNQLLCIDGEIDAFVADCVKAGDFGPSACSVAISQYVKVGRHGLLAASELYLTHLVQPTRRSAAVSMHWRRQLAFAASALIAAFGGSGAARRASLIFVQLKADLARFGKVPPLRVYNAILDAYLKNRWRDEATAVWREMKAAAVEPDRVTYNSLIAHGGSVASAHRLRERMQRKGLKADGFTYGGLLACCARHGDAPMAEKVWDEMVAARVDGDAARWSCLLSAYRTAADMPGLRRTLRRAEAAGCASPTSTCIFLLACAEQVRSVREAGQEGAEQSVDALVAEAETVFGAGGDPKASQVPDQTLGCGRRCCECTVAPGIDLTLALCCR
eukprot:TRINITY_DN12866_c0_g1_i3.p1 TRINITY_DN12866_c0_g1~~TRINITY_DN12866_c0_g1_i3.p1  ORF type:complete len:413 (+),score=98.78 TRINITY_DN12866_c0_g1_i3:59-1297(+)